MKEYKVGDTIYVKGKIKQIDEYDTSLPYCVDFGNTAWITSDNIIDELPTAEPVKPVLPKKVADELDLYKNAKCGLSTYLKDAVLNTMETKATNKYLYRYMSDNSLRDSHTTALINAWNNGYTVEKPKRFNVKVPQNWSGDDKHYWSKEQDGSLTWACLINKDYMIPTYQFTLIEIEHYGLQDCEKEEVTDDDD